MSNGVVYFRDEKGEHSANPLLAAMAERIGVGLDSTESPVPLEAMERACARCESHERCADWTHSPNGDYDRKFCENTNILDRLSLRPANMSDPDWLRWTSFKTDVHPDREIRSRQPAITDLPMREEFLPLHASPASDVGGTDAAEDVSLMAASVAVLRGLSAAQGATGQPDAQDSKVEGEDNGTKEHDDHPTSIPHPIRRTVQRALRSRSSLAIAASIAAMVLFGGGAMWGARAPSERDGLLDEIAGYHVVYSRETAHLVEVPANQAEQLTAWLGERIDHEIKVPDLADAGLHFAGGRMLVVNDRPVAELMYTRARGLPVAVCVTQIDGKPWSMVVEQHGALRLASWATDAYAYVVVGEIGDAQALEIAWLAKTKI